MNRNISINHALTRERLEDIQEPPERLASMGAALRDEFLSHIFHNHSGDLREFMDASGGLLF